jgi:chitosanase
MNEAIENKIIAIMAKFETGRDKVAYDGVYVYNDGRNKRPQVTLSYGFTEDGGNLIIVLQAYFLLRGVYWLKLRPYLTDVGRGVLHKNEKFKNLLREMASDPIFRKIQDLCFVSLYINKGYSKADEYGVKTHLGIAVIIDSVLHGSLDDVANEFPELRPSRGGNEKIWVKAYLNARIKWLTDKGKPLSNTTYRPLSFLDAIEKDNWDLSKPFIANGTTIK